MKPFTFKFKFRLPASEKPVPPLPADAFVVDFEGHTPDVAKMMRDGKMPIPKAYEGLTKGQLSDIGCKHVRLSKKHAARYVDIVPRKKGQYDS